MNRNSSMCDKNIISAFEKKDIRTNTSDLYLEICSHIKNKTCLFVAPHPDDEIIGCGATLAKLSKDKFKCQTLYMTYEEESLRGNEAKKASTSIGVNNSKFLNGMDGKLELTEQMKVQLTDLLSDGISVVFVPSIFETHPDHLYTTKVVCELTQNIDDLIIVCYEVWCPMLNNGICKVSYEDYQMKMNALKEYKSQLRIYPLKQLLNEINLVRAKNSDSKYAEAFYLCTPIELKKLIHRYNALKEKMKA